MATPWMAAPQMAASWIATAWMATPQMATSWMAASQMATYFEKVKKCRLFCRLN